MLRLVVNRRDAVCSFCIFVGFYGRPCPLSFDSPAADGPLRTDRAIDFAEGFHPPRKARVVKIYAYQPELF